MADNEFVENLKALTGLGDEEARHLLEASGGDLEAAIELHFSNAPSTSDSSRRPSSSSVGTASASSSAASIKDDEGEVRAPIARKAGVLVQESFRNSYGPSHRMLTSSVFDRHRDFRAESAAQRAALLNGQANGESDEKLKALQTLFQPPVDIMHSGPWESAKAEASERRQWLLVNVQNAQEFACQTLNRDVWSNATVKDLVRNNFVFWQVYGDSADGARFETYYRDRISQYPFLAVIDPRTGELVSTLKAPDPLSFCETVTEFLSSNPNFESFDRRLIAKPPVQNSLESETINGGTIDDSKKRKRQSEDEEEEPMTKAPNLRESPGPSRSTHSWRAFLGSQQDPAVEILLRFPDGSREQIAVPASSQLQAVALLVEERGYGRESFDLVLNFPKRVLSEEPVTARLSALGLHSQEVIHVEKKEDSDDS